MAVFTSRKLAPPIITAESKAFRCGPPKPLLDPDMHRVRPRALVSARRLPILYQ
jgi:hypothetical protein